MRRYFNYILCIAAFCFLAGCALEEMETPTITDSAEDVIVNGVPMVFTASFQDATKTSVTPGAGSALSVEWEAGDQIRILCVDGEGHSVSVIASAEDSGKTSAFAATVPQAEAYYAVYPASCATSSSLAADGSVTINVPRTGADGRFSSASICVAKADSEKKFVFRSAASIVKFTLDTAVDSLQLANVAGGALVGEVIASFDASGVLSVRKGDSVYPIASTGRLPAGENYVAVIPGTYSGSVAARFDKTRPAFFDNGSVDFNLGHVVNVGAVQQKAIKDYYITEGGTGSGISWSDAGNAQTVMTALHRSAVVESAHTTLMRIWKCQGASFNFAAGTYVFGSDANKNGLDIDFISFDDYAFMGSTAYADTPKEPACLERVKINFLGGYPAGGGDRNPAVNSSVLSGEAKYRIMAVRDLVDLTCDGITFANASATTATVANSSGTASGKVALSRGSDICGAAVYLSDFWENPATWKAVEKLTRPHVDIVNCRFTGNLNSYDSSTGGGRSCIAVAKGQCHVLDSRFIGNFTKGYGIVGGVGGAGYVENANRGELFFDGCLFMGNKGNGSETQTVSGTVCYSNSKGTFICWNNCTFKGNNNDDGYINYGVIYANRNYILSNCTFVEKVPENEYNTSASSSTRKFGVVCMAGDVLGCRDYTLVNNIILDSGTSEQKVAVYLKNDSSGILTGSGGPERDARLYSGGGNIVSGYYNFFYTAVSGVEYGKHPFLTNRDRNDETFTAEGLGLEWDDTDCVYKWSGNIKSYVPLTSTDVVTSIGSNVDIGDLFSRWLSDENRLYKDALGNLRGDNWTPGAYQAGANN